MQTVRRLLATSALALVVSLTGSRVSATPPGIPYGGQLNDPAGAPYTGTLDVEASLFAQEIGGSPIWGPHTFTGVEADNGAFAVILDDATEPLADALDGLSEAWLEFSVKPDGEQDWIPLEGRQQLLSVPYAHVAENAANSARLGGVDALDFVSQTMLAQQGFAKASDAFSGSFLDLSDVPPGLLNDDQDTLALLTCSAVGYVPKWTGAGWDCGADEVGEATSLDGVLKADGSVALTGPWDLGGQLLSGVVIAPSDAPVDETEGALWFDTTAGKLKVYNGSDWDELGLADVIVAADLACTGCVDASDLNFSLATVATTGKFADLVDIPDGLADGDDDQLQEIGPTCVTAGDVAKWNGSGWECAPDEGVRADELQTAVAAGVADQLAAGGPEAVTGGLLTNKFSGSFSATDTPVGFTGYSPIYSESVITIPDIGKALSFTVTVNLQHPDATALDVHLVPPAEVGSEIILHQLGAGTAGGLIGTYPTDLQVFQGSFDDFIGKNLAGAWTLKVRDNVGPPIDDSGSIESWSIWLDYVANSQLAIAGSVIVTGTANIRQLNVGESNTNLMAEVTALQNEVESLHAAESAIRLLWLNPDVDDDGFWGGRMEVRAAVESPGQNWIRLVDASEARIGEDCDDDDPHVRPSQTGYSQYSTDPNCDGISEKMFYVYDVGGYSGYFGGGAATCGGTATFLPPLGHYPMLLQSPDDYACGTDLGVKNLLNSSCQPVYDSAGVRVECR